jgi:hypothetical protein
MGVRFLYVYKAAIDQTQNVNILTPFSAWDQVYTRQIPTPLGQFTGQNGTIVIHDFNPAYRGAAFVQNQLQNASNTDTFNNFEVSINRRKTGKWYAETSFVGTKNHRYTTTGDGRSTTTLIPQSPNDLLFPLDTTWELAYRASGSYDLPWGISASTLIQVFNGLNGFRTYSFTAADPSGGARFASSSVISLPVEAYGSEHGQIREFVNARLTKSMKLGRARIEVYGDGTNLLNGSTPWGAPTTGAGFGQNLATGPTFGYITRLQQPRALRVGASFEF